MQKIGDITPTANAEGEYREGSAEAGVGPTLIKADWLNTVQRELVNAIVGLGIALDPQDDSQLLKALEKLAGETAEWDAIKHKPTTFPPAAHAHTFSSLEQTPPALLALSRITSLSANATLSADQMGLVQIDASAAARTITLPASAGALGTVDVVIRRTDNSGNRLVVKASGADRIMFHTHLSPTGYPFFVLMGAGDWWHLRSDGNGKWLPIGRYDNTPLGRPVFETTTAFSPGGWVGHNGFLYNRAEWPWAWDHAQQSGMLTTEALRLGNEGGWTSGDGTTTFRSPEARGEFLRVLDESRDIDSARVAGSWQVGTFVGGDGDTLNAPIVNLNDANHIRVLGIEYDKTPWVPETISVNATGSTIVTNVPMNGVQAPGTASGGCDFGRSRPRNIAYPGRIKLI